MKHRRQGRSTGTVTVFTYCDDPLRSCAGATAAKPAELVEGKGAFRRRSDIDNRNELFEGGEVGGVSGVNRQAVGGRGGGDKQIC
jgi:hypothetical protein